MHALLQQALLLVNVLHCMPAHLHAPTPHNAPEASASIATRMQPVCRLGSRGGAAELKAHPFFADFDWSRVLVMRAPNVPSLRGELDTSNFEQFEEEAGPAGGSRSRAQRTDADFLCFAYKNMRAVSGDASAGGARAQPAAARPPGPQ